MTYYTSLANQKQKFAVLSRQMGFKARTAEDAVLWRDQLRGRLKTINGMATMSKCALDPVMIQNQAMDGYTREKWTIQTELGVYMPFYVLIPGGAKKKHRVVLAPHGHGSHGKDAVVGNRATEGLKNTIEQHNYDYGVQFVKRGFIVFCPDARGFGERRELRAQGDSDQKMLGSSCYELNMVAISLGQSLAGLWAWDLQRLLDYVETREDADAERIACAGLSGGGLQTMWLTALDDRIKAAVISGYFYGVEESLLEQSNNCSCNFVPHLWEHADMGDFGALIAPRPLLVETGDIDGLNGKSGVPNVESQLAITREAYRVYGAEDKLRHHVFNGPHKWCGEKAIPFVESVL